MNIKILSIAVTAAMLVAASVGLAQPGSGGMPMPVGAPANTIYGFSRNVLGTLTITNTTPVGCGVVTCTSTVVTVVHCFTNRMGKVNCITNQIPQITCTNNPAKATSMSLRETLQATITTNATCDEVSGALPDGAVLTARLDANLRLADWRGQHVGSFKIMNGTNVFALGTMAGSNGVNSNGKQACAVCNHWEGLLQGTVVQRNSPLTGAAIQATYSADLTDVTVCPSPSIPQGTVMMTVDGVVITLRCPPPL